MPDAAGFLTRKVGPLPIWTYGVAAAALVALIALYRRGQSTLGAQQPSIPASPFASSNQGVLNYPPTVVVTPAGVSSSAPTTTTPSGATSSTTVSSLPFHFGAPSSQSWVWRLTPSGIDAWQRQTGAPPNFQVQPGTTQPPAWLPAYSWQVAELPPGVTWQSLGQGAGGGDGGDGGGMAGQGRGTLITRPARSVRAWGHFTPFAPQQFVDGSGGMGAGAPHPMSVIARRVGISETRLRSLNYHLRRRDGSYRPGIIRVS